MKKESHCTIRNEKLFCLHCGGEQILPFPLAVSMFGAMAKEFERMHKNCEPTWKQPEPDMSLSKYERIKWWIDNGEHGTSSNNILFHLTAQSYYVKIGNKDHPNDPDDFRRCYLLLKAVPELKDFLNEMKQVSEVWSKLVDNWDKLTDMLEEQFRIKKANRMYEFMKSLGC